MAGVDCVSGNEIGRSYLSEVKYHSPVDDWLKQKFQPFAKIWFEIVRNAFVVALLNYVASKANNGTLSLLASFTFILFGCYCLSFIVLAQPIGPSTAKNKYLRWFFGALTVVVSAVTIYYWSNLIVKVIDQLVKAQLK